MSGSKKIQSVYITFSLLLDAGGEAAAETRVGLGTKRNIYSGPSGNHQTTQDAQPQILGRATFLLSIWAQPVSLKDSGRGPHSYSGSQKWWEIVARSLTEFL